MRGGNEVSSGERRSWSLGYTSNRWQMMPLNASFQSFQGFLRVQQDEYLVQVHLEKPLLDERSRKKEEKSSIAGKQPMIKIASLQVQEDLHDLMQQHGLQQIVQTRVQQCTSLEQVMQEIAHVVEHALRSNLSPHATAALSNMTEWTTLGLSVDYYETILKELDELGWNNVVNINDTLNELQIQCFDSKGRVHRFTIMLPPEYPRKAPICTFDLPTPLHIVWKQEKSPLTTSPSMNLVSIVKQVQSYLEKYQAFWNQMDDLDEHAWILEPLHPSRACNVRRVAVEKNCSVQVKVNPHAPHTICELNFFGSDRMILPLREKWNRNYAAWNNAESLRVNLAKLLQVTFPSPRTMKNREEMSVECGICYCYRLQPMQNETNEGDEDEDGIAPTKACENPKCARPFHATCLLEWIQSIPDCKQSFNTFFGHCPYCQEHISVAAGSR